MPLNRRDFVVGTLAAAGCGCLASCAGSIAPPMQTGPVDIGTAADYPNDGVTTRWADTHGFYLVRQGRQLFAVSSICTHRRCLVKPQVEKGNEEFACGCHGSRFAEVGTVLKGPATTSLPHLAIAADPATGHITVDPEHRFDERQYGQPGSFIALA